MRVKSCFPCLLALRQAGQLLVCTVSVHAHTGLPLKPCWVLSSKTSEKCSKILPKGKTEEIWPLCNNFKSLTYFNRGRRLCTQCGAIKIRKLVQLLFLGNFWHYGLHVCLFLFLKNSRERILDWVGPIEYVNREPKFGQPAIYRFHWHFRQTFVIAIFPPFTVHCVVAAAAAGGYSGMDIYTLLYWWVMGFSNFSTRKNQISQTGPNHLENTGFG